MFNRLRRLFQRKPPEPESDHEAGRHWDEHKSRILEGFLGKEHDMVMHAIIPYAVGGFLDLYYYPKGVPGTAVATKELSDAPTRGSSNRTFKSYEMVMFTRHELDLDAAKNKDTAFGKAHSNINSVLNLLARYSAEASLNPGETCSTPEDMERVGGKCFVFDGYGPHSDDVAEDFGLLLVIEVHRSEMEYAREHGGDALLQILKDAGHHPYSDLDREPVV